MTYELFTAILILVFLFILGIEYTWLYLLADRQEKHQEKYRAVKKKVAALTEGIFYAPTGSAMTRNLESLRDLIGDDTEAFEIADRRISEMEQGDGNRVEDMQEKIRQIYGYLDPISLFAKLLKNGDVHHQGYACRRLADFDCYDYLEEICRLSESRNRTLAYNAAMALSRLGYAEGVAAFVLRIQDDKRYSGRIINEIFATFSLDRVKLASLIIEDCNEYMKCTTIKAIAQYGMHEFEGIYKEGCVSKNTNMRIACVKALGILGDPLNERLLIVASKDRDWVVRLSAVNGLSKLHSAEAVAAVQAALNDKEWWVRQAAANALLNMDVGISRLEDVIKGDDRYASDAMKLALYKNVDLRG